MLSLYISIGVMLALAIVVYLMVASRAQKLSRNSRATWLVVVFGATAFQIAFLRDSVWMVKCIPLENMIVYCNWLPIACALVAALAQRPQEPNPIRRHWTGCTMACMAVFTSIHPFLGSPPNCHDSWQDDICRQSTRYSCTAACAVTLLRHHGIPSTESEMAEHCLTRKGTTWQGLYRGLRVKTRATAWNVVVTNAPVETLKRDWSTPMILSVGIPSGSDVNPIYVEQYGWPVGQLHSVVLFGWNKQGQPKIGDPGVGREHWSSEDLNVLYRGVATKLESRITIR